jgi:hypothetical protein
MLHSLKSTIALALLPLLLSVGSAHAQRTLIDIDLTRGSAEGGKVRGGAWDNGWKPTDADADQIVWDLGFISSNGYAEVTFVMEQAVNAAGVISRYFGAHTLDTLNMHFATGPAAEMIYVQGGRDTRYFSCLKAFSATIDMQHNREYKNHVKGEPFYGEFDWWQIGRETTVRLTWKADSAIVTCNLANGEKEWCTADAWRMRHVFIGSDNTPDGEGRNSLPGQRFTRIKVVDFDLPLATASANAKLSGRQPSPLQISHNGSDLVFTMAQAGSHSLAIHRLDGTKVKDCHVARNPRLRISAETLAAGTYVARVTSAGPMLKARFTVNH